MSLPIGYYCCVVLLSVRITTRLPYNVHCLCLHCEMLRRKQVCFELVLKVDSVDAAQISGGLPMMLDQSDLSVELRPCLWYWQTPWTAEQSIELHALQSMVCMRRYQSDSVCCFVNLCGLHMCSGTEQWSNMLSTVISVLCLLISLHQTDCVLNLYNVVRKSVSSFVVLWVEIQLHLLLSSAVLCEAYCSCDVCRLNLIGRAGCAWRHMSASTVALRRQLTTSGGCLMPRHTRSFHWKTSVFHSMSFMILYFSFRRDLYHMADTSLSSRYVNEWYFFSA